MKVAEMMEKRRAERKRCDVSGRILVFDDHMDSIECEVVDITDYGALLRVKPGAVVPRQFELMIGTDPIPHPCRLARQTEQGFGIEFLDPIRNAIETTLIETLFKEELLLEASYGRPLRHSPVRKRLSGMVDEMMKIIVERGPSSNPARDRV